MRFLDEGVEQYLVEALRSAGYVVDYVAEFAPGMQDEDVLAAAARNEAVLVTNDKDFGEIVFKQQKLPAGVLLLRLAGVRPADKILLLLQVARNHGLELARAFSVLSGQALRIRRSELPGSPVQFVQRNRDSTST